MRELLVSFWRSVYLRLVLLALVLLLFLLDFWGLSFFGCCFAPSRAGDVATWFSGILTLVAVVIAFFALRTDRQHFQEEVLYRESERLRELQHRVDERVISVREAAGQVYAWLESRTDTFDRLTGVVCRLDNRTELPIYRWVIVVRDSSLNIRSDEHGPMIPGLSEIVLSGSCWIELFREGTGIPVSLVFDASNGELLRRDFNGRLGVARGQTGEGATDYDT